jgi:hypothetical protein
VFSLRASPVALLVLLGSLALGVAPGCQGVAAQEPRLDARQQLEARWGVHVVGLRRSAGGFMLEFRFRVTDPERARPLFARGVPAYALDRKSGTRLAVPDFPKAGPLRSRFIGAASSDQLHYVMFSNADLRVRPGDRVAVVIGGFQADDLTLD